MQAEDITPNPPQQPTDSSKQSIYYKPSGLDTNTPTDLGSTAMNEIAQWLYQANFPFDWHSEEPPPAHLLRAVIHAWAESHNESYERMAWSVRQETGWETPPA